MKHLVSQGYLLELGSFFVKMGVASWDHNNLFTVEFYGSKQKKNVGDGLDFVKRL